MAIQNVTLVEELRAGRERLHALWCRHAGAPEKERRVLAGELRNETEQILLGLRLLESEPRNATVARHAAGLRSMAESVQESLRRLEEFRRNGAKQPARTDEDTRERRDSRRTASHRNGVRRRTNSHRAGRDTQ
jgi:hypothetical protein